MKKLAFLLASAGLLLTACIAEDSRMTEPVQETIVISASYDAPDSEPGTKSTLDENGGFEWTAGDAFIALNANGYWYDFTKTDTEYADKYKANFIGFDVPGGSVTFPAVFPARAFSDASGEGATLKPDFTPNDNILRVYFPNTIAWTEGQVNNYMVSNFYRDNANNIRFLNMAGMLKFVFSNVPVNATKFAVSIYGAKIANTEADKSDVSTWFSVDSLNLNDYDDNHPTTFAKKIGEDEFSTVTFTFDKVVTAGKSMTFYLPVPQMDLNDEASLSVPYNKVKIQFLDDQDNVLESITSSKKDRYIRRKQIKTFPSITFMTGGAETKVVEEVNPTAPEYNQTFTLPKTSNDVIVKVYKTTGTITLEYASDATSDEKPSNVTVRMVSDGDQTEDVIEALNIQLPASHVTIETDSENDKIKVNNVTAVTSNSTLVVKSGVTVGTLTVAQGNAGISGKVNYVTVQANETQGTTPIVVDVEKSAAVKTVTLNTVATVHVEQPQGKIDVETTDNKVNVIVNDGAAGSTATAQNGGDIYVTANAAIEVVANGTGSTITVDPQSETPGEIEPVDEGGEIIFGKAAKIDDVEYNTLPEAFAAATDGKTIVLLSTVQLTERLFVNAGATPSYGGDNNRYATTTENKALTLDLNGFNINTSSNIALAGGTLNIVNNGATASAITSSNSGLAPVEVRGTGNLNAKRTLTVGQNVTLVGAEYGLNVFGSNDAQANSIDVTVDGTINGSIFVLGNLTNENNVINITVNGTVAAPANENGIAINGNASVVVNEGATVSGDTGIEVRAGKLTVNGGTITANATAFSYKANNSGTSTKGAAVAVSQHSTVQPITATVTAGTLSGPEKCSLVIYDAQNNALQDVTVIASGAIKEESTFPNGFAWVAEGNNYKLKSCAARIGADGFDTLPAAFAAATNGKTIVLLKNAALTERLFVNAGAQPAYAGTNNRYATTTENKVLTLDLNGFNINTSSNIALAGGTLEITNSGTADVNHGVISTTTDGLAPVEVRGTGNLNAKRTLTIGTGVTLTGTTYGLNIFGSNDNQLNKIEVNVDGTVNGTLFVLGNLTNTQNEININVDGTVSIAAGQGSEKNNAGIALCGYAAVNVSSTANVTGETGIEVRAGRLDVSGGTISANVSTYSYTANNDGTSTKGAAVAVSQHNTCLPINVTLAGGTFSAPTTKCSLVVENAQGSLDRLTVAAIKAIKDNCTVPEGFTVQDVQ